MSFVRNAWYPAAWSHELGYALVARTLLGEKVVLYRTPGGAPAALEDRCCHKYLPLSMGKLKGDAVECGYHGMTFNPAGACVRIPGQASIPAQAQVRAYPVTDHLGLVWVWMGEAALADKTKLFRLPAYDAPGWTTNRGPYTYVRTAYQNITDNLLDPMHVSFVHLSTLGSPEMADIPVETEQDGDKVTVIRWTLDKPPVPIIRKLTGLDNNCDRWQYYNYYAPSVAITDFGSGPVGMGHGEADRDAAYRAYSCHFIAPETERSSHYFWMQVRNFAPGDAEISKLMTDQLIMAFSEDVAVLEAIQAAEDEHPPRPPVKLVIDNGPQRSRRIVERLIRAERQQQAAE
ncbi:MAG: aromatic ring-hydroxylating dioxygenase subunit alpha [Rhodospirillaceae bacterium]|nr:aromatic ring-hydroxylating dioxygenase subunit alpha [Rhodospirillaceae bacterium]